ncbi:acyl-CoA N-acyltransferase [Xylariaceae sp. FL0016]|nr:acyl-CoA N-acyltransferase [Xylariaceae sp. FL0016]
MSFVQREPTPSDIPSIVDAIFDAYRYHPVTGRAFIASSKHTLEYWSTSLTYDIENPNSHFLVLTDPNSSDPEGVVGFAKWDRPFDPASPPPPPPEMTWPEDGDRAFGEKFFGSVAEKRKEIMKGRRHWYLAMLGIRWDYQGKGLGGQLLRWGLEKADADGLEVFLGSSPWGAPVYTKHGFDTVETMTFDDGKYLERFMLRPARRADER